MKITSAVIVTAAMLTPTAYAVNWYDGYDFLSRGVVGYWPLDGDARDVSGNGHDGTLHGDVFFTVGRMLGGASFDGNGDYIALAGQVVYANEFTACGWILQDGYSENSYSYIFIKTSNTNLAYQSLGYYHDPSESYLHVDVSDFGDPWYLRYPTVLPEGEWHHICTTVAPGDVRLFIDGAQVSQLALTGTLDHDSFTGNYIGGFPQILYGPYSHHGLIDDVVVFDRVLSPSEIMRLGQDLNNDGVPDYWVPPVDVLRCDGFEAPLDVSAVTVHSQNRVLPFRMKLLASSGAEVDGSELAAAPVLLVTFGSGTAPAVDITTQTLEPGSATLGNQFVFADGWWQLNVSLRSLSAPGSYTFATQTGDDTSYVLQPTCKVTVVLE